MVNRLDINAAEPDPMVRSGIDVGHSLQLQVVAEGVESEAEHLSEASAPLNMILVGDALKTITASGTETRQLAPDEIQHALGSLFGLATERQAAAVC